MREIEEQLAKEWAKMLAEHPEQAEHFARVLQGEKTPVREEEHKERVSIPPQGKQPVKKYESGRDAIMAYFNNVAEEHEWQK